MGTGPPGVGVLHTSGKATVVPPLSLVTTDILLTPVLTAMGSASEARDYRAGATERECQPVRKRRVAGRSGAVSGQSRREDDEPRSLRVAALECAHSTSRASSKPRSA